MTWRYQGSQGEMTRVADPLSKHQASLDSLARAHESLVSAINQDMQTDLLDGDQTGYDQNQHELDQENSQYGQAVASENARFQSEIAGLASAFVVKVSRKSKDQPVTLISAKGSYQGSITFDALAVPDYYFIIQASGPFQIEMSR